MSSCGFFYNKQGINLDPSGILATFTLVTAEPALRGADVTCTGTGGELVRLFGLQFLLGGFGKLF